MVEKVKNLIANTSFQNTVFVSAGVFVASIFSYFVQIYLGRSLSVESYGIFNTLLSMSVVVGILASTFMTSIVKTVARLKAKNKISELTQLYIDITLVALLAGFIVSVGVFVLRNNIATFLKIEEVTIISFFAVYMFFAFLQVPPIAYLQGFLKLKQYALTNVLSSLIRLGVVVVTIFLGYRVGGIYVGLGLASVLSFTVYTLVLKSGFTSFTRQDLREHYKGVLLFAGPVLFVQIGMILLNNVDIILVKHYFDGYSAGLYAGLVTVSKVFLFAANTIAVAMFPQISAAFSEKKDYMRKFSFFLKIQLLVIGIGLLVFKLFPGLIVQLMFGDIYMPTVTYLPKFVLFFGFYVLLNFMTLFLLAVEKTKVFLLQIPAILVQVVLISFFHSSIDQVINMNLITAAVLLVGVSIYSFTVLRST
jgi:O-antigen/teichoic acid export membrane protein